MLLTRALHLSLTTDSTFWHAVLPAMTMIFDMCRGLFSAHVALIPLRFPSTRFA